jgi:uncharacterized membrane protein
VRQGEHGVWLIETDTLKVTVDPANGGRISSLVYLPVGQETIYQGGGLALDHFWEQSWPGEFLTAPYQVDVAQPDPAHVVVTATRTSTGKWGNALLEPLSGLVLTRRMEMADGQPQIQVTVAVANPNPTTKMFGYWTQQIFTPANRQEGMEYFRPSNVGINKVRENRETMHTPAAPEVCYVKSPVAGWTATVDPPAKAGIAFLMNYADMSWLYNCVGMATTEWMYDRVVLPPGKSWNTQYTIRPFTGLASVAHASNHAIVSITPVEKPDAVDLNFALIRSTAAVAGGTLQGEIVNLITGAKVPIPVQRFAALGEKPVELSATRPGPLLQQILVRVSLQFDLADGSKAEEKFEYFYGGRLGFSGQNLRLDLSPIYIIPSPAKQRRYIKPDVIQLVPHTGFNIVWVQGMFYDYYGVEQASAHLEQASLLECVPYGGLLSEGLQNFPMAYDDLLKQDVIVLTDVAATAIDDNSAERIKDFVEAGGGLLVFGGPWSLGKGSYQGTKLGDLLPVELLGKADFRKVRDPLRPVRKDGMLAGLPWKDSPRCYVLQEVKPRAGAEILLQCGKYPALITWKVGRGRVAVAPLTVFDESKSGEMPWWQWPRWPSALAETLRWLAGKESR